MTIAVITRERADALLGPYLSAFGHCFILAEADWQELPPGFRKDAIPSFKALFYWHRAVVHAREVFEDIAGARLMTFEGIPMVEIEDKVWARFNKMRASRTTAGYPTVQRQTLGSQGHLGMIEPDDGQLTFSWGDARPILVCGYVLDDFGRIADLYMAYPVSRHRNAYDIPISMAAAADFVLAGRATPVTPGAESTVPVVRPKVVG